MSHVVDQSMAGETDDIEVAPVDLWDRMFRSADVITRTLHFTEYSYIPLIYLC